MNRLDVLSLWVGFLTLGMVGGWTPVTLALSALALGAGGLRGRVAIPRAWMLPGALLVVLLVFALPLQAPQTVNAFVGLPSYKVALIIAVLTLVSMLRANLPDEQIVVLCMGTSLTMACGMTMQRDPYLWLVAAQATCLTLALGSRVHSDEATRYQPLLQLVCLVPVLALAGLGAYLLGWSETRLNEWMQNINYGLNVAVSFPHQTRLSALRNSQNSPMLIVRVFSARPPAYLVGRCYVKYHNLAWEGEPGKTDVAGTRVATGWTYPVGQGTTPAVEDNYELAATQAATLLLPRDGFELTLPCERLVRYGGGTYQLDSGANFDGSYRLARAPGRFAQQEQPGDLEPYLALPEQTSPAVARLAREAAGTGSPLERAARLESWFHEHFEYGYGYPFDESKDPVEEFLTRRPAAHCELFACSMALMLRSQGIPSRYVVGFLVRDRNAMAGYSVVRARDAHAWVEAYVGRQGWVTFDPTPPQALAPSTGFNSWLESLGERLVYAWGRLLRQFQTNPWEALKSLARGLTSAWVVGPVTLVFLVWWARRRGGWRWLRQAPHSGAALPVDPELQQLQKLLQRLEARLAEAGQERPLGLTLLQWEAHLEGAALQASREFLRDYCRVRYGRSRPTVADLERLEGYLATTV